jgi:xanthine dehydrogenase YagS FAD-binding subunit
MPGSGCAALDGYNRIHAILGTSEKCIATHPGDMAVALVAFDAVVLARGRAGIERTIPINDFYVPYGEDPARETVLEHGELITAVELPSEPWFVRSCYIKVRDRASYEFALVSAAVALDIDRGRIRTARVALGGVGTRPWRSTEAENVLIGAPPEVGAYRAAAEAALHGARTYAHNGFKIELAKRTLIRTLTLTAARNAEPGGNGESA